ncbi:unnamed protein product, partial [Prorocentrum cordatum]
DACPCRELLGAARRARGGPMLASASAGDAAGLGAPLPNSGPEPAVLGRRPELRPESAEAALGATPREGEAGPASELPRQPREGGARPRFEWPPALAVLSGWGLACAAGAAAGRACSSDPGLEPHAVWWGYAAGWLPHAVLAAWCVGRRRAFSWGLVLHAWTWRYGACGAAYAAAGPLDFWLKPCYPDAAVYVLVFWNLPFFGAGKAISVGLVVMKVRALGHPWLPRFLNCCLSGQLLCGAIFVGANYLQDFQADGPLKSALDMVVVGSFGALGVAFLAGASWGLAAPAARAARSSDAAIRRAAAWGALTAAAFWLAMATFMLRVAALWNETPEFTSEFQMANILDNLFDCLAVSLLSGLVGPPSLRRLAEDAFEAINSYTEVRLQECYERYLAYLDDVEVKWVRLRFLRRLLAEGRILPRSQEVPASEAALGSEGFPRNRGQQKHRFVTSHPWLSKEHPDPAGTKLRALVEQLDALGAEEEDGVFLDWMSLPQHNQLDEDLARLDKEGKWPLPGTHPAVRTVAEEARFKKALDSMETMYSVGSTPVVVLPMEEEVERGREYISRGWCLLEFSLALSFGNIANAEVHPEVRRLSESVTAMKGNTVAGFRKTFKSTHFTNSGDRKVVLRLFEQTLAKAA